MFSKPSFLNLFAIFAQLVVFPTPLTPSTIHTFILSFCGTNSMPFACCRRIKNHSRNPRKEILNFRNYEKYFFNIKTYYERKNHSRNRTFNSNRKSPYDKNIPDCFFTSAKTCKSFLRSKSQINFPTALIEASWSISEPAIEEIEETW